MKKLVFLIFVILLSASMSFVSAGVGIKKYQESLLVNEGEEGCIVVGAYNPFSTDTNIIVGVSDSLKEVLTLQEADTKLLPAGTSSDKAIEVKFCFEVPIVYQRDCSIGSFICALSCDEPQKVYDGEIFLQTIPLQTSASGVGGSTTSMSVSQDMAVRVACNPHPRDYTLVYVLAALISAIVIGIALFSKYRKPKAERIREKMQKLKQEMKAENKGKKK